MLAPSSNHLAMPGSAAGGAGAALAGAAFASSTITGAAAVSAPAPPPAARFKCVSFMRHSIATHNEAAARSTDAMESVYLSEAYADSSLSHRGQVLVRGARQAMAGLSPAPSVVLCSPLTRAIQTAIAMFGGTRTRIVAVPEAREAYGRFPCDRHRDRSELELMFGDSVDFGLCDAKDVMWSPHHREEMSQLNNRVSRFLESVLERGEEHVFVVSHGVFMEAAIQQLTFGYPGDITKQRVHNCEVHSFVFSAPPSPPPSSTAAAAASATLSSTKLPPLPLPLPLPPSASIVSPTAPALAMAAAPLGARARTLTVAAAAAAAAAAGGATAATSGSGSGGGGGGGLFSGGEQQRTGRSRPRVEAYLTGQGLALACAAGMPLPDVAHVNRIVRRFSGDGRSLTEPQFSVLLARCGLAPQETRWLYCALDREGGGRVASGDFLLALMAFYSGEKKGEAAAAAAASAGGVVGGGAGPRARVGLMDLRMRYQREMYGTPLSNHDLLEATFKRILSTVLAAP